MYIKTKPSWVARHITVFRSINMTYKLDALASYWSSMKLSLFSYGHFLYEMPYFESFSGACWSLLVLLLVLPNLVQFSIAMLQRWWKYWRGSRVKRRTSPYDHGLVAYMDGGSSLGTYVPDSGWDPVALLAAGVWNADEEDPSSSLGGFALFLRIAAMASRRSSCRKNDQQ